MLKELLASGLVRPLPNPAHAKAHLYALTEAGEEVITAIRAEETTLVASIVNAISAEDIEAFVRVQAQLNDVFRWESRRDRA